MEERSYKASSLDNSNVKMLQRHRNLLTADQRELLHVLRFREAKSKYMERQQKVLKKHKQSDPNEHVRWSHCARCGIVLMSASTRRKPFVYCGHGNATNKRGLCHLYRYCPVCNWAFKAKPLIAEFVPDEAFHRANWWFVTVSYTTNPANAGCFFAPDVAQHFDVKRPHCVYEILGTYDPCPIPLNDDGGYYDDEFIAYWEAGHHAVKALKRSGVITGYVGNDDLAIRFDVRAHEQYCPCAGLPHTHYIVTTPPGTLLNLATVEDIQAEATARLQKQDLPIRLYATVKVYGVRAPGELSKLLRYVVKPIDFVEPYGRAKLSQEARLVDGSFAPGFLERLNIGVDCLFDSFENGRFYRRRGVRRAGILYCSRRTGYIGTRPLPPPRRKRKVKLKKPTRRIRKQHKRIINDPDYEF